MCEREIKREEQIRKKGKCFGTLFFPPKMICYSLSMSALYLVAV